MPTSEIGEKYSEFFVLTKVPYLICRKHITVRTIEGLPVVSFCLPQILCNFDTKLRTIRIQKIS